MSKKYFPITIASAFLWSVFAISVVSAQYCPPCEQPMQPQYVDPCVEQMVPPCATYTNPCTNQYSNYCTNNYGFSKCRNYNNYTLYARAEAVFWNFDDADKRPLIMRYNGTDNLPIFSGNDVDYDSDAAPRITLGVNISPFAAIEGQYMGLFDLKENYHFLGDGNLLLPGALGTTGDFFNSDSMRVHTKVDMHSAELNFLRRLGNPNFAVLAGFRYVNFEEEFDLNSTPYLSDPTWSSSDYQLRTKNDFYGGQIGLKSELPLMERFGLQFVGKAGVYSNRARQSNMIQVQDDTKTKTVTRNASAKSNKTAFLGEVNFGGYVKITDNIQVVGGYNVLWVGDVARAFDQMDFTYTTESGKSLTTDSMLLHGANVGLEMRF